MTADESDEASRAKPPDVIPQAGWTALDPLESVGTGRSFVSGEPSGDRLRVAYFRRESDGALVGKVWFGRGAEGPPGHAHGGSMAAVLDEAMGAAAWMAGHMVLAVKLTTDFKQMLPLGTDASLEAWVERVDGRKVLTRGVLSGADGKPFATAEGIFLVLQPERFSGLAEVATAALDLARGKPPADTSCTPGQGQGGPTK